MSNEEEKEIKIEKGNPEKKILLPTEASTQLSIGLDLPKKDDSYEQGKEKEEKKGEVTEEELLKSRAETNLLCGTKRPRSFSNKEEFETSLKDFTCTICMDYMVGAKKLLCGHCFCQQCISFWFLREKFCPICKEKVRDEKNTECTLIDFTIENILMRGSPNYPSMKEDLKNWQTRKVEFYKWKKSQNLK